jgi:hypothetical protein
VPGAGGAASAGSVAHQQPRASSMPQPNAVPHEAQRDAGLPGGSVRIAAISGY